jgi:drug/metabolite transporter (DMT)-like permease
MSRRGWVLFLAMGVIWGVPYLMIKVAVEALTPASLVFLRTAVAALVLLPIALARGQVRPAIVRWRPLLAFTIAELAVPWLLLSNAERRLTSSLSGLLIAAVPLVGALLGWATGGERLGPRRLAGLGIGIVGVAALVGLDLGTSDVPALIQMAIVAIGYAVGPFILARYLTGVPGFGVISAALTVTALAYLPGGIAQLPSHWPAAKVIGSVAVLAVLCTAVAFLVFFALIDEVGPVRATVITYVNPAIAVALGVVLLGESLSVGIVVGFALVLVGSVLATRRTVTVAPVVAEPVPVTGALPRS